MRLNMPPLFTINYIANCLNMDVKLNRKIFKRFSAHSEFSYSEDLIFCKFMHSAFFSAIIYWEMSSFIPRIFLIIAFCSNEQMIGVYAWRVIAFMANLQSFWNYSEMYFPGNAMCFKVFISKIYSAVVICRNALSVNPQPTFFSFFNVPPKSFRQWFLGMRIRVSAIAFTKHLSIGDSHIENAITI